MFCFIISDPQPPSEDRLCLEDLNYDCLKAIFKRLDIPSQFAIIKSCEPFKSIILYDIWYPHYKNGFDLNSAPAMADQPLDFQSDALKVILKNFIKIKGISLEIFNKSLDETSDEVFAQVEYLSISNHMYDIHDKILDTNQFCRFPSLVELNLERVAIDFRGKCTFPALKILYMQNVIVLGDAEGDFLQKVLTPNLEKLSLISLPFETIYFENFSLISRCYNLRELAIGAEYLHDSRVLSPVANLTTLEVLTLHSKNCFYFKSRDHCIFSRILKMVQQNPCKTVEGIQMNGMPQKNFFFSQYLKQIKHLNWMVAKIFHRKSNGSAEWTHDVPDVIVSFYDFIENNRYLETLYVRDNIFHMRRLQTEKTFNDKVHTSRAQKHFPKLNIISDYKNIPDNPYIGELKEGYMKFIFKQI